MLESYNVLNAGGQWTHILWTNYKHLIPKTVELFAKHGAQVRELKELKSSTEEVMKIHKIMEGKNLAL